MAIWFTSDQHLGHAAVINFCKRPFTTVEEMDRAIVDNWNRLVQPDDWVYVLGDISFHKPRIGIPLMRELTGKKVLVRGNHDKYSDTQYASAGFVDVAEEIVISIDGQPVRLSHYPYMPSVEHQALMPPHELRYPERRPPRHGYEILLCGHVHERWCVNGRMINVGVDIWEFEPVPESEILGRLTRPLPAEYAYGF